jgi:hypothetical protein
MHLFTSDGRGRDGGLTSMPDGWREKLDLPIRVSVIERENEHSNRRMPAEEYHLGTVRSSG